MNKKSIAGILCAAGLCGLMLTACGKKDDTAGQDGSGTTSSAAAGNTGDTGNTGSTGSMGSENNGGSISTDGADTVHGDNPGRSRDIDGDGFVEDVIDDAEDIVDDAARGVGDVLDDLSPDEHDNSTVTTTNG